MSVTESLAVDAPAVLALADGVLARLPGGPGALLHRRLLVVGGAAADGLGLALACAGAQVSVLTTADAGQRQQAQAALALELLERLPVTHPECDPGPLLATLGRGLPDGRPAAAPRLDGWLFATRPGDVAPFDVLVTHDLLGRVSDLPATCRWLLDQLVVRGPCLHWVDTRDREQPGQPLEALTLDPAAFAERYAASGGGCGNRWRPASLAAELTVAGAELAPFETEVEAHPAYLDDLLPRLHADFAGMLGGSLVPLAGWLVGRRRAGLNTEYPTAGDHPQTLAHSRCRYDHVAPLVAGRRVLDVGCGAGLGTAELVAAGAASVVGIEKRSEALALAAASAGVDHGGDRDAQLVGGDERPRAAGADDPEAGDIEAAVDATARAAGAQPAATRAAPRWLRGDLEQGLPFADASFDVVVALEVLEHVVAQRALIDELRRVLAPGGVAVVSVPHEPFERLWTTLAGEPNPYHLHVPELDEFVGLFAGFGRVELAAQVDTVASLVLPLASGGAAPGVPASDATPTDTAAPGAWPSASAARAELDVPAALPLDDRGTVTVIATAWLDADAPATPRPIRGRSFGNHQARMADSIEATERLKAEYDELRQQAFAARNELAWRLLEEHP